MPLFSVTMISDLHHMIFWLSNCFTDIKKINNICPPQTLLNPHHRYINAFGRRDCVYNRYPKNILVCVFVYVCNICTFLLSNFSLNYLCLLHIIFLCLWFTLKPHMYLPYSLSLPTDSPLGALSVLYYRLNTYRSVPPPLHPLAPVADRFAPTFTGGHRGSVFLVSLLLLKYSPKQIHTFRIIAASD